MPIHSPTDWILAIIATLCIGLSKSGFSGIGLVAVIIMAHLFPPLESTGVVLPMLIFGDICAVVVFQQHANWKHIRRMLPPTLIGIVCGWVLMHFIPNQKFGPVIGSIVLIMVLVQTLRQLRPDLFRHVPHSHAFAWTMGCGSGVATMLANAAGPIMALYLLSINLPKYELIGTSAWFFCLINLIKVPFSAQLGLIHGQSLLFNLVLAPCVIIGALLGKRLVAIVPQRIFETLLLIFAGMASLRLLGLF